MKTFQENKSYNDIVSPYFENLIHSLKGQAYLTLKDYENADIALNLSLNGNPHDFLALTRKAKLLCEVNLF